MNYLTHLFFYSLDLLSSVLNFLGSIFGLYPKLELGMSYLLYREEKKVTKQDSTRESRRSKQNLQAQEKLEEAKRLGSG